MKTKKILYIIPTIFLIMFVILTLLVAFCDYEENATGLISFNRFFGSFLYNRSLDIISDIFLIIAILSMFVAAGVGLYQLISNKSIKKVDRDILLFGISIILMITIWISFDYLSIAYRPYVVDGYKPSFPSTHLLVVSSTYIIISWMINKRCNKQIITIITYAISFIVIILTFAFRILSGMHWFTDCLGGLLMGLSIAFFLITIDLNLK